MTLPKRFESTEQDGVAPTASARRAHRTVGSTNGRERFFDWLNNSYRRTLDVVLRHRRITLAASLVLTVATVALFIYMPKGFMPTVDTGMVFGGTEAAQDTSYDEMVRLQEQVVDTF